MRILCVAKLAPSGALAWQAFSSKWRCLFIVFFLNHQLRFAAYFAPSSVHLIFDLQALGLHLTSNRAVYPFETEERWLHHHKNRLARYPS